MLADWVSHYWNRLPSDVVDSSSHGVCKLRLHVCLKLFLHFNDEILLLVMLSLCSGEG